MQSYFKKLGVYIRQWWDNDYYPEGPEAFLNQEQHVDWARTWPFIVLHAGCLGLIWVGWNGVRSSGGRRP